MNREIDFDKMQGLAPAIVQDAASNEVLMLGFMNREACERTLSTGYVTFFSRTRNQLWTKGDTSRNRLKLVAAAGMEAGAGIGMESRAAAGMALSMGFKLIGNYLRQPAALLFAAAAFAGVSLLHFSLPVVVLVLAPVAMAWYWPRGKTPPAQEVHR